MKRIEFIAPVEAMRGNLSGAQKLQYPTDNQGAYEGPMGSVNYARNYSPRFVGAKIAKSGKKYFSVRLRSANHLTAKSKKAMALLGGTGAIYAAILKVPSLIAGIQAQYNALVAIGEPRTFRKYVTDKIRSALKAYALRIEFVGPASPVMVDNPWTLEGGDPNISVPVSIILKFASELTGSAIHPVDLDGLNFMTRSTLNPSAENYPLWTSQRLFPQFNVLPVNGATRYDLSQDLSSPYTMKLLYYENNEVVWRKKIQLNGVDVTAMDAIVDNGVYTLVDVE